MNTASMDGRTSAHNQTTLAHEFGHVIGLNALKQSNNNVYLMYVFSNRSAIGPTSSVYFGHIYD